MEILGLGLFIIGIVLMLLGLSQFFGLGWAALILDILSGTLAQDYTQTQIDHPKAPTNKGKFLGLLMIASAIAIISLLFFYF